MKSKFDDCEFKALDYKGKINYFVDSFGEDGFHDATGLKQVMIDSFEATKGQVEGYTVEEHIQLTANFFAETCLMQIMTNNACTQVNPSVSYQNN